jgi:hypothetical protein
MTATSGIGLVRGHFCLKTHLVFFFFFAFAFAKAWSKKQLFGEFLSFLPRFLTCLLNIRQSFDIHSFLGLACLLRLQDV